MNTFFNQNKFIRHLLPDFFSSVLIVFLFLAGTSYAQTGSYKNEFGFRSDNDAYLAIKQDRYYTNGLFISFRHAANQEKLGSKLNKLVWEAEIGHKMYTAISAKKGNIRTIDRPFTAYAYAGGGLNLLYHSEKALKLSLQLGLIGPSAKGKEVQEIIHDLIGFYDIAGWETQLETETGLNGRAEYTALIGRSASSQADISFTGYAGLGNTFSGLGAGALIRLGRLQPLYGSVSTGSRTSNRPAELEKPGKEFFFFLKPAINAVIYDATIQGGLFSKSKGPYTFDAKPLVFSQDIGVNYSQNRFTATFHLTFNTREIKSTARPHQYGSVSMYYRFN